MNTLRFLWDLTVLALSVVAGLMRIALLLIGKSLDLLSKDKKAEQQHEIKALPVRESSEVIVESPRSPAVAQGPVEVASGSGKPEEPRFKWADSIVVVQLDPPVAQVVMKFWRESGKADRVLKVMCPRLRAIVRGQRFDLGDVPIGGNLEEMRRAAGLAAQDQLNLMGNPKPASGPAVGTDMPVKREDKKPAKESATIPVAVERVVAKHESVKPQPNPVPPPTRPAFSGASKTVNGADASSAITYQGTLVGYGERERNPSSPNAYNIFEADIVLDDGTPLSLSGVELKKRIDELGARNGERFAITALGKVPIGGGRTRNQYDMKRL